jgi:hypothetical protein
MRRGELKQVDTSQQLYDRPVNLFVGVLSVLLTVLPN